MRGRTLQNTLKSAVTFTGTGLHSGAPVRMVVRPASADYGIWFRRTDVIDRDALIPARWDVVVPSKLCTLVENKAGAGGGVGMQHVARSKPDGYTVFRGFASYSFEASGVLNTITARVENATDTLYRNHLNYLKDLLPEVGRSFKLVYAMGF